jgi:hypothetical protein
MGLDMQTKFHWALAILALVSLCSGSNAGPITDITAQTADVQQIDVTDSGIYTANKTATMTNDMGLTHHIVNNIQLVEATNTIPVQLGVKFGFRFTLLGTPQDARVTIRQVTIYPSKGVISPKKGMLRTNAFESTLQIGMSGQFAGYDVDDPWELVPGIWTIQLWIGDRKLAERSFTVVTQ